MMSFNAGHSGKSALPVPQDVGRCRIRAASDASRRISVKAATLLVTEAGRGQAQTDNKVFPLQPGAVVACPAGTVFEIKPHGDRNLLLYQISMAGGGDAFWFDKPTPAAVPYRVLELCGEMERLWNGQPSRLSYKLLACFYETLHLIREHGIAPDQADRIEQTLAYMREHYAEEISRRKLAQMSNVSLSYFSHWFKGRVGCTYTEFLTSLRIEKARELLLASKLTVNDIARQVGYKDAFYFSRKFKHVVGVAPTVYLQQPRRIVSLSANCTAFLLSLGVVPVAAVVTPWIARKFRAVLRATRLLSASGRELDADLLAADNPDLIVCYDTAGEAEVFRGIATTLPIRLNGLNWREQLLLVADATRSNQEAEQLLARYDEKAGRARDTLAATVGPHDTVAVMEIFPDCLYIYGNSWGKGGQVVYESLRLKPPANIVGEHGIIPHFKRFACQEIANYAADHLFVGVRRLPGSERQAEKLLGSTEWRGLAAARRNRVYFVDSDMFYGFDPVSLDAQLTEVMKRLSPNSSMPK